MSNDLVEIKSARVKPNRPKIDMQPAINCLMKDLGYSRGSIWYVNKRVRNEGVRFLTVLLPALSKHILICVEQGRWTPFDFDGLSPIKTKGRERYTYFLYDELCSIFSDDQDCALNLWRVRQLCEYCYKLCLPFDPSTLEDAERKFLATESSITFCPDFANKMRKFAETNFRSTRKLTIADVIPECRFGPGTFADYSSFRGETLQNKKDFLNGIYAARFDAVKGAFRVRKTSLLTGKRMPLRRLDFPEYSEVLFVPKDSRGPRTIVREPSANIFWQMGLHEVMRASLQNDSFGRIQFDSQEEFKNLARLSSLTRDYATIDLKDASDSVSFRLAETVFQNFPAISWSFQKARTAYCKLPSGNLHKLTKLSGMGSGFTFPLMASLIYSAICVATPKRFRKDIMSDLHVYGDDIIVPRWALSYAKQGLSLAGFHINCNKSFVKSYFRESCGGDFYKGESVAPVRLKQLFVDNRTYGSTVTPNCSADYMSFILKLERHCRELINSGLCRTAEYYYLALEKALGCQLPSGSGDTPALVRYSILPVRRNPCMVRAILPKAVQRKTSKHGFDRSFKDKLLTLAEDSLGVTESLPFGIDSERRAVVLISTWIPDLTLTGFVQESTL